MHNTIAATLAFTGILVAMPAWGMQDGTARNVPQPLPGRPTAGPSGSRELPGSGRQLGATLSSQGASV